MKLYFWQQRKPNTETGSSEWISMILYYFPTYTKQLILAAFLLLKLLALA